MDKLRTRGTLETQKEKNLLHDLKQRVTNEWLACDRLELEVLISFSKADYWHRSRLKWQWQKSWCDGIWSASAPMNLLVRTQCSEKIKKISILTFSWLVSEASNAHSSPVWEVSLVLGSNPGHVVFLALVDDNVRETSQLVVLRSVEKIPCLALVSDSQELNLDSTVWCNRELSFFSRAESWPEIYMKKIHEGKFIEMLGIVYIL